MKRKIVTNILDRSLWLVWYLYFPYRCGRSVPFVPYTVFRWGKLVELKGPGRDLDFINRLLFLGYHLSDGSDGTFQERQTHSSTPVCFHQRFYGNPCFSFNDCVYRDYVHDVSAIVVRVRMISSPDDDTISLINSGKIIPLT